MIKTLTINSDEAKRFRRGLQRDEIGDMPIAEKRQQWEQSSGQIATPSGVNAHKVIMAGVSCLLLVPDNQSEPFNLIVYLHGGGLVEGSSETSRVWCARIALATDTAVLVIDYRLAPEHPYPAAQNDTQAVLNKVMRSTQFKQVISVGAESSGAILALQAMIDCQKAQQPLPASMFFLSPSLDLTFSGDSISNNHTRDPFVSKAVLEYYATLYAGSGKRSMRKLSPLFNDLSGLPATSVHVDEDEILLDDSQRLVSILANNGISAELVLGKGLWHTWPCWGDFPESAEALEQIADHIRMHAPDQINSKL